jgi:hypothetical protein
VGKIVTAEELFGEQQEQPEQPNIVTADELFGQKPNIVTADELFAQQGEVIADVKPGSTLDRMYADIADYARHGDDEYESFYRTGQALGEWMRPGVSTAGTQFKATALDIASSTVELIDELSYRAMPMDKLYAAFLGADKDQQQAIREAQRHEELILRLREGAAGYRDEVAEQFEDMTFGQKALSTGLHSMAISLPIMAASIATGPTAATAMFGLTESARAYSENLHMGMSREQALNHAMASGALEFLGEAEVTRIFGELVQNKMKEGLLRSLTRFMAAEIVGENLTEIGQRWNDAILGMDKEPTAEEIRDIMALTTVATMISGGGQAVLGMTAQKLTKIYDETHGDTNLREQVDLLEKELKKLDEAFTIPEDFEGLLGEMTEEMVVNELRPIATNLAKIVADNPVLAKELGLNQELIDKFEARISELETPPARVIPETDIIEGKVHLRDTPDDSVQADATEVKPAAPVWERDPDNFSTPKTKAMQKLLETDDRITGLSIEPDGVFIYTDSSKWSDDAGAGTFTGKSETAAIKDFKDSVRKAAAPPQETTVKRAKDFKDTGNYDVTLTDGTKTQIYRDTDQFSTGVWHEVGAASLDILGYTRKEAIATLERRTQQAEDEVVELDEMVPEDTGHEGPVLNLFTGDTVYSTGVPIQVLKNPSETQLRRHAAKSGRGREGWISPHQKDMYGDKALRWIKDDEGNYYFWDASLAIHDQIVDQIAADQGPDFMPDHDGVSESYVTPEDIETGNITDITGYEPPTPYLALGPVIRNEGAIEAIGVGEDTDTGGSWDWMPFSSHFRWIRHSGSETHRMNKSQRRRVARILERLPVPVVSMVRFVGIWKGKDSEGASAEYTTSNQIVRITEEALNSAQAVELLLHEFAHGIDFYENGESNLSLSQESELFKIDFQQEQYGKVLQEALDAYLTGLAIVRGILKKTGRRAYDPTEFKFNTDVLTTNELLQYANENIKGPQERAYVHAFVHLTYPFEHFQRSKNYFKAGGTKQQAEEDNIRNAQFYQVELFAQAYMLHNLNPKLLRDTMPQAATLMRNIHESAIRSKSIVEFNSRVRKALRAPGAGTSATQLSEITGKSGTSLGVRKSDQTVRGPPLRSEPYRPNLRPLRRNARGRIEFTPGAIIFEWMVNRFGHKFTLLKNMQDQFEYRQARRRAQAAIKRAERLVERIHKLFKGLDAETQEGVYRYLVTEGATPEDFIDPDITVMDRGEKVQLAKRAKSVKRLIRALGLQLVHAGLLEREIYEQHKDQYLPQMYLRHILGDDTTQMLSSHGKLDAKYLIQRNENLTALFKEAFLGQVFDPAYLVPLTIGRTARDLALLEFMTEISGNKNWVAPASLVQWETGEMHATDDPDGRWAAGDPMYLNVTPQWLLKEANRIESQLKAYPERTRPMARVMIGKMRTLGQAGIREIGLREFDVKNYMQLADNPSYGPLRGSWVRKEIRDDLIGAMQIDLTGETSLAEQWIGLDTLQAAHSMFKLNKVALNPPTVFRNVYSNTILLHLSGVPLHRLPKLYVKAIKDYINKGALYRVATRGAIDASTFTSAELSRLTKQLDRAVEKSHGRPHLEQAFKVSAVIGEWLHKVGGTVFQFTEMIGKMVKIQDELDRGSPEEVAIDEADKWLFDYSEVPRSVEWLRKYPFGAPFITFYYKVVPRMIEVATKYPWRFLPYMALYYGMWGAASWKLDIDWEDLRRIKKQLPEYMRDGHAVIPWPYRDAHGNLQFLDLSYVFPWTMPLELATKTFSGKFGEAAADTGMLSGPILKAPASIIFNQHHFYKTPIYDEQDPPWRQGLHIMEFIYNQFAPGALTTEPGNAFVKMMDAYKGQTDAYGNLPPTMGQAIARGFGWNAFAPNRPRNLYFMQRIIEDYQEETKVLIARDPANAKKILERRQRNLDRMIKEFKEYVAESEATIPEAPQEE